MPKKAVYFACRKTIEDNSNYGQSISQDALLTIFRIVKGKIEQVTQDSSSISTTDKDILTQFLERNPGFRRRREKILHLITNTELLCELFRETYFNEDITIEQRLQIDEDGKPEENLVFDANYEILPINEEQIIGDSDIDQLGELCKRLGIQTIVNGLESINFKRLEPMIL